MEHGYSRIAGVVVLKIFFLAASGPGALAKENRSMKDGVAACKQWCDQNNKTINSQSQCYKACEVYWLCNGSDSTAITCEDGKQLAISNDPTKPTPPKKNTTVVPQRGVQGRAAEKSTK